MLYPSVGGYMLKARKKEEVSFGKPKPERKLTLAEASIPLQL